MRTDLFRCCEAKLGKQFLWYSPDLIQTLLGQDILLV